MPRSPIQKEHVRFIKWAIEFAQDELQDYTPGKWKDVQEKFLPEFVESAPDIFERPKEGDFMFDVEPTPGRDAGDVKSFHTTRHFSRGDVNETKEVFWITLRALAKGRGRAWGFQEGALEIRPMKGKAISLVLGFRHVRERALAALGYHLDQSRIKPEQIRPCPYCERIFYLARKPRRDVENFFCSVRCQLYYNRRERSHG